MGDLGVQEDVGAPSVELVEHRIERGVTDIGPADVREQRNTVEPKLVERVADLS